MGVPGSEKPRKLKIRPRQKVQNIPKWHAELHVKFSEFKHLQKYASMGYRRTLHIFRHGQKYLIRIVHDSDMQNSQEGTQSKSTYAEIHLSTS